MPSDAQVNKQEQPKFPDQFRAFPVVHPWLVHIHRFWHWQEKKIALQDKTQKANILGFTFLMPIFLSLYNGIEIQ